MSNSSTLTALLPSTSYTLTYALPLLFFSLVLTFAGTFLTLDRSRSFPPSAGAGAGVYAALPVPGAFEHKQHGKKGRRRWVWLLEGGVGGMAGGWAFGVHLSTFLALLIPATTPSASLSPKAFLAVWLLSCTTTTLLAARYRYAAYLFISLSGGSLTALALSVLLHPSLPTRIVLVSTLTPLLPLLSALSLLPRLAPRLRHPTLRLCTAATGAFGLVIAIALLSNPAVTPWANVWERLWVADGDGWGTGRERALSAAWGVFFVLGMLVDWGMRRWLGECPDEKWDSYLAKYARDLPNLPNRQGTFQPLTSIWDRLFPPPSSPLPSPAAALDSKQPILFPDTTEHKTHPLVSSSGSPPPVLTPFMLRLPNASPGKLHKSVPGQDDAEEDRLPCAPAFLRKKTRGGEGKFLRGIGRRERRPVRFGVGEGSGSEDEEEGERKPRAWMLEQDQEQVQHLVPTLEYDSESATLVDGTGGERAPGKPKHASRSPVLDDIHPAPDIDYDADLLRLSKWRAGIADEPVDYSDFEEDDLGLSPLSRIDAEANPRSHSNSKKEDRSSLEKETTPNNPGWSPKFLERHRARVGAGGESGSLLLVPVPATPSLVRALGRIEEAQREVFGPGGRVGAPVRRQTADVPRVSQSNKPAARRRQTADAPRPFVPPAPSPAAAPPRARDGLPRTMSHPSPSALAPTVAASSSNPHPTPEDEDDEDEEVDLEQGLTPRANRKEEERAPRWEEFWREVRAKART